MELEKQGKMDVQFAARQIAPQQFDTNNWINPSRSLIVSHDISLKKRLPLFFFVLVSFFGYYYSSSPHESIYQDWMDKGKRVAYSSSNYIYTPSFASSSESGNILFSQIQNTSPYTPLQVTLCKNALTRSSLNNEFFKKN